MTQIGVMTEVLESDFGGTDSNFKKKIGLNQVEKKTWTLH